jgi:hypothetical protein
MQADLSGEVLEPLSFMAAAEVGVCWIPVSA